jgi:hypothetical protein
MPTRYVVRRGDCVASIAFEYGFFPKTLWEYGENAELRKQRRDNPNALAEGDVLVIPEKRDSPRTVATGATHTFRRKGVPAKFRVQLYEAGEPLADQPFVADVDGTITRGTTDGSGKVEVAITPSAAEVKLSVGAGANLREYHFELGGLDPVDTVTGAQQRLANLGFLEEDAGETAELDEEALRAFQLANDLQPSGELDDSTVAKLAEIHDGK